MGSSRLAILGSAKPSQACEAVLDTACTMAEQVHDPAADSQAQTVAQCLRTPDTVPPDTASLKVAW